MGVAKDDDGEVLLSVAKRDEVPVGTGGVHGAAAVLTLFASAVHADEITSTRCSVSFKSGDPGTPNANDKFHVKDVAECQFQCDLFSSFGACSWFIYVKSGVHENCALYGPGLESMEEWFASHNLRGQPILHDCPAEIDDEEKCVTPPSNRNPDAGSPPYAPMNFAVADCTPTNGGDITMYDQDTYEGCLAQCRALWNDEAEDMRTDAPYMTYNYRAERCTCAGQQRRSHKRAARSSSKTEPWDRNHRVRVKIT